MSHAGHYSLERTITYEIASINLQSATIGHLNLAELACWYSLHVLFVAIASKGECFQVWRPKLICVHQLLIFKDKNHVIALALNTHEYKLAFNILSIIIVKTYLSPLDMNVVQKTVFAGNSGLQQNLGEHIISVFFFLNWGVKTNFEINF